MTTAYERENLSVIRSRVLRTVGSMPYSFSGTLATALAGMSHMLHGHIDYLAKNMLPDSATDSVLDRWSAVFGMVRRPQSGPRVRIYVKGEPGAEIPLEWVVGGSDFVATKVQSVPSSGEIELECIGASEPEGFQRIVEASIKMARSDIETDAVILSRTPESPVEDDDSLRRRLLAAIQSTPQGGSFLDYIRWAESVPGVKQAWVKPWHCIEGGKPGHVWVTWLEEHHGQSESVRAEITKLLTQVAPAHACVTVPMLSMRTCPLQIKLVPNTAECRIAVTKAVHKFFVEESKPGGYLDQKYEPTPGVIARSRLTAAISAVDIEQQHSIVNLDSNIVVADGELVQCSVEFV